MEKKHVYLGVFAKDDATSKKLIKQYVIASLKQIYQKYPSQDILADINNFDTKFSFPKDTLHITTLFIGNNKIQKLSPHHQNIYKNFKFGESHQLKSYGILYVPNQIIVGVCYPQTMVSNQYPHMTLFLTKSVKPVQSNDVCAWAFKDSPQAYKSKKLNIGLIKAVGAPKKYEKIYTSGKNIIIQGILRGQ